MLHSTTTFLSFLCYYTSALFLTIQNPSFEDDGPIPDNTYMYSNSILSGWTNYDETGKCEEFVGVTNPTGSTVFDDPQFGTMPPHGTLYAYIEQWTVDQQGKGDVGFLQKLTENLVTVDTTYTLRVYVGHAKHNCWSDQSIEGTQCGYPGFAGYRVQLLGANTLIEEDDNSITIPQGEWRQITVRSTVLSGNNAIGKVLKIRLLNKNPSSGDSEVVFDDVTLEAVPAGETTVSPTKYPTKYPTTKAPTAPPSAPPTAPPSAPPVTPPPTTKPPTLSPNTDPTVPPVIHPTASPNVIREPTASPTVIASDNPITSEPSVRPSKGPSSGDVSNTNTQASDDNNDKKANDKKDAISVLLSDYLGLMIGVAGIVCGCFCFCVFFLIYKVRKNDNELEQNEAHMIMMHAEKVNSVEIPAAKDEDKGKREKKDEQMSVELFFRDEVNLPQYCAVFVDEGYDSMRAMMAIKNKEELMQIGVMSPGHQTLILSKLFKLKAITEGGHDTAVTSNTEEAEKDEAQLEEDDMTERMRRDRQMVKAWFDFNVGLGKYKYDALFIKRGYESMKAMQSIRDKSELEEIGVTILGHRALIFSEIERLRSMNLNNNAAMYNNNAYNGNGNSDANVYNNYNPQPGGEPGGGFQMPYY